MLNNKFFTNILALIMLILFNASSAFSQLSSSTTSAVIGVIKDQQQSAIVGGNIAIENLERNIKRNLISDEKGQFYFANLPIPHEKIPTSVLREQNKWRDKSRLNRTEKNIDKKKNKT